MDLCPRSLTVTVALLALSALVTRTAAAQTHPLPRRSDFVSSSHYNLRRAPGRGAQSRRHHGRVELRAARDGSVTLTDGGERHASDLDPEGQTHETIVRWSHRFTGRLTRADGGALRLELRVEQTSCQRELRRGGAQVSTEPCDGQTDRTLRCEWSPEARGGWSCAAADDDDADTPAEGTPPAWRFVAGRGCVARTGGSPMSGMPTYGRCRTR